MNKEEKEAIKLLKSYENKLVYEIGEKDKKAVKTVINLIQKHQKEIDNLKIKNVELEKELVIEKYKSKEKNVIMLSFEDYKELSRKLRNNENGKSLVEKITDFICERTNIKPEELKLRVKYSKGKYWNLS